MEDPRTRGVKDPAESPQLGSEHLPLCGHIHLQGSYVRGIVQFTIQKGDVESHSESLSALPI